MNRRSVTKAIALSLPLSVGCASQKDVVQTKGVDIIKPRRLKPGDTIGLISPGSSLSDAALEKCVANLEKAGFRVKPGRHWKEQHGYLAGIDKVRLEDIHAMFEDDSVDGVWCARGGYGCSRLLPYLDYNLIKRNPKVLIGYSDITALINSIYKETGLIGFHGPVASSEFNEFSTDGIRNLLQTPLDEYQLSNAENHQIEILKEGRANGRLVGGNLTLLASMCGTLYQVEMKDKLVFIEDVGEKPYRIDRMLTQLLQSSRLSEAAGIILGRFNDCEPDEGDRSLSLRECLIDRLGGLNIPIALGFSFGHISEQFTIPVGVMATFDTQAKTLLLNEAAVL
ncbi:MAG: muramoyltetrapeptide carboxypeptidase [Saprospiraceae bacterium]|jgi:muramoyltetrapeptide carboxypeptidase